MDRQRALPRIEMTPILTSLPPRFLFSLLDFLVGGSIGYIATYFAIRRLYASIRVD
jgi:hypothetical protein